MLKTSLALVNNIFRGYIHIGILKAPEEKKFNTKYLSGSIIESVTKGAVLYERI